MKEVIEDGIIYWIGQSAADNWEMLLTAKKHQGSALWLWFHLDNLSSAYVIVCATKDELKAQKVLKTVVSRAADLCKSSGKYRDLPKGWSSNSHKNRKDRCIKVPREHIVKITICFHVCVINN
jgi:hypothetical protein